MNIRTVNKVDRMTSDRAGQSRVFRPRKIAQAVRVCAFGLFPIALTAVPNKTEAALPLPVPSGVWTATAGGRYSLGTTTAVINGQIMDVQQRDSKVILPWDGFDIGTQNTVEFHQPDSNSIALNRIDSADPSQILGALKANGQVYLVNKNGFVFGKDSTVDVNSLVVSTLPISDDTFQRGITKVFSQDGRAAFQGSGEIYLRNSDGSFVLDEAGQRRKISVDIQQGAQIQSALGGRVLILAPKVQNAGEIRSIDGQVILTASTDKVYLAEDANTGGLLVEVKTGGEVNNLGHLLLGHGGATLMGFAVNQEGSISATTSVLVNGSIRLLAREGVSDSPLRDTKNNYILRANTTTRETAVDDDLGTQSEVRFRAGSVTEVLPDVASGLTAVDQQTQYKSSVDVMADRILLEGQSLIDAPSGHVNLVATTHPQRSDPVGVGASDSRIMMAAGSRINTAGLLDVAKTMESNVVEVDLRTYDLRDAPLQKDGVLNGSKVRVDIRTGSPIFDISAAVAAIPHTIEERSTVGGQVNLSSEGDVVVAQGATIDVSGGSLKFSSGIVDTTQLIGATDGKLYDIGSADPNMRFSSVAGEVSKRYDKWGITRRWKIPGPVSNNPQAESGYIEGKSAGAAIINTHGLILDGDIVAATVAGRNQRQASDRVYGGTLSVDLVNSLQGISFSERAQLTPLAFDESLPTGDVNGATPAPVQIDTGYFERNQLRYVSLSTIGIIDLPAGTDLSMLDKGHLALVGNQVRIDGAITAHGSDVSINVGNSDASIQLGANAIIDTSGQWRNDNLSINSTQDFAPFQIDAGSIFLTGTGDISLNSGSSLVANGGGWVQSDGSIVAGNGGDVAIAAMPGLHDGNTRASDLNLDGEIQSQVLVGDASQGHGGTLSIETNMIDFVPSQNDIPVPDTFQSIHPLYLTPEIMTGNGFSAYEFRSNFGGINLAGGVHLVPRQQVYLPSADLRLVSSGVDPIALSMPVTLPLFQREAVSLLFEHVDANGLNPNVVPVAMAQGASIDADPLGRVSFVTVTSIYMDGSILAPGGNVDLTVLAPKSSDEDRAYFSGQGIWLGDTANLSVDGISVFEPNPLQLRQGEVFSGGTVNMGANRGYVVIKSGARISAAGASAEFDLVSQGQQETGSALAGAQLIASSGGSINLLSSEGIFVDGAITAPTGGTAASGGSISIALDRKARNILDPTANAALPDTSPTKFLDLQASIRPQWHLVMPQEISSLSQGDAVPSAYNGVAMMDLGMVGDGGFSSVSFANLSGSGSEIRFSDSGSLSVAREIVLDTPQIVWDVGATEIGPVSLNANHIALGSSSMRGEGSVHAGAGQFLANAELIDIQGDLGMTGFAGIAFSASGDMRFSGVRVSADERSFTGTSTLAGDLLLAANRIYPTTLSDYSLTSDRLAVSKPEAVALSASTMFRQDASALADALSSRDAIEAGPVLSARGRLTVRADDIQIGGTILAPLGSLTLSINMGSVGTLHLMDGGFLFTSGNGAVIPFGQTQAGIDWLFPLVDESGKVVVGGSNLVFGNGQESLDNSITLNADRIALDAGASIDLSAGGDIQAYEFIQGSGGSQDWLLDGDGTTQFAIVPGITRYAPVDPMETPASALRVGDAIHLTGIGVLPDGDYALLPSHYALLDGAYLITPVAGTSNIFVGEQAARLDGAPIVAGYRLITGTDFRDPRWSGFAIEKPDRVKARAEYLLSRGSVFLPQQAASQGALTPFVSTDAGSLDISAGQFLSLGANIQAKTETGGRGGQLDIVANRLAVVSQSGLAQDGEVELLASSLDALQVESILLGGTRQDETDGTRISVQSRTIRFQAVAGDQFELSAPEFMIAATDRIDLSAGVAISSKGTVSRTDGGAFLLSGDAAVIRLSEGVGRSLKPDAQTGSKGVIDVQEGATLQSNGAMMLDASQDTLLDGELDIQDGSLTLGASRISLGEAPRGQGGLVLNSIQLASLSPAEMILSSRSTIDIYGQLSLTGKAISLSGGALVGHGQAGDLGEITADTVLIENTFGSVVPNPVVVGDGSLRINADILTLGEGEYALTGFSSVDTQLGALVGQGTGSLRLDGNFGLDAAEITGSVGATTQIDASGHAMTLSTAGLPGASAPSVVENGLGAAWELTADRISGQANIRLPSGSLNMTAVAGALNLAAGTRVDVSGSWVQIGSQRAMAPAGQITLASSGGNISIDSAVTLNLSGVGDAGQLNIVSSGNAAVTLPSNIDAHGGAGARGGVLSMTVDHLDGFGLDGLNQVLISAGFNEGVSLRTRSGDLTLGAAQVMRANAVKLSADTGSINVQGTIDAHGEQGGRVELAAGDIVDISGVIDAHASNTDSTGKGGQIHISATDTDGDGVGAITLDGTLDVGAGAGARLGKIGLRTLRVNDDVAFDVGSAALIKGVGSATVEAVQVYDNQLAELSIDSNYINIVEQQTLDYMARVPAAQNRLGNAFTIVPGIEIRNSGSIRLSSDWDLAAAHMSGGASDLPGQLTFRAGGDLIFDHSLSDGFGDLLFGLPGVGTFTLKNELQTGLSWSYSLVAGADLSAADIMATQGPETIGDVILGSNVSVRTGTGDIRIAASRDLTLSDSTATIYSAGRAEQNLRWGNLDMIYAVGKLPVEFPVDGGDVSIAAGRDIQGASSRQLIRQWLLGAGDWNPDSTDHSGQTPTAWGPNLLRDLSNPINLFQTTTPFAFQQNIASLGGGDIAISAGHDLNDLSVMLPSNGKPIGDIAADSTAGSLHFLDNTVLIQGGGKLTISVGANVRGGIFYDGLGTVDIRAGGALLPGTNSVSPVLALGNATFKVLARSGISIGNVIDPLTLPTSNNSIFFGYGPGASVDLTSLAGNVILRNDSQALKAAVDTAFTALGSESVLNIYPSDVRVASLSGDIRIRENMSLFPSTQGQLDLLAAGNISTAVVATKRQVNVLQSDADPALLPSIVAPSKSYLDADVFAHSPIPVHLGDTTSNHIVAGSDIVGQPDALVFKMAKSTDVEAGRDLLDTSFSVQNVGTDDSSSITAGRDIRFNTRRNANGVVENVTSKIEVAGPGELRMQAGRTVDLGSSDGVASLGNTVNPALAASGAAIKVLAGALGRPSYQSFSELYLVQTDDYLLPLQTFLAGEQIDLSQYGDQGADDLAYKDVALAAFAALPAEQRQRFLDRVFFNELKLAGVAAAKVSGKAQSDAYDRGRAAITAMFPAPSGGDLSLLFSKIQTLDGGGIDVIVPKGLINAGVANAGGVTKDASKLGIVTQVGGDVSAYVSGDFLVNQSRVFAMGGGSILVWSNEGNIDAGRGAKSALSAPPPSISFDQDGNLIVTFPPAVSGSGIRTFSTVETPAGDVFLFAPSGIIDAGEAGIAGNNVTLAATQVIGADRIEVGGIGTGVPVTQVGGISASVSSASTVASSSSKSAEDVGSVGAGGVDEAPLTDSIPGFVIVELLGFGAE